MIFGCADKSFDDEAVDSPNEDRRIIQLAAFRQHGLVVEHMREIREGRHRRRCP